MFFHVLSCSFIFFHFLSFSLSLLGAQNLIFFVPQFRDDFSSQFLSEKSIFGPSRVALPLDLLSFFLLFNFLFFSHFLFISSCFLIL